MTEIAYHPTHVRALRETFKALRTAEFPWTADTIYLNNASIGPIPERTRRALDEFTAKRTAPHLLPDRELFAGLAAPARNRAADQCRPVGDRARHQHRFRFEPRGARAAPEGRRCGPAVGQGIPGERVSLADAARSGRHRRGGALPGRRLARR